MAATATRDPVLQWSADAQDSGGRWGVDPPVLLGLVDVESGGRLGLTSSAGAQGLTQFEPATRADILKRYGVDAYAGGKQAVEAAAIYLHELGYSKDPAGALAAYNAGPANPAAGRGYAQTVLARARRYAGLGPKGLPPQQAPPATSIDTAGGASGDPSGIGGAALKALLWVVLVGAGAAIAGLGVKRLSSPAAGAAS